MAGNATDARRSVISKLSVILRAFSQGGAYTLSELAEQTGLPVSTTHRLATELAEWQVLERCDDRRFRPGLSLRTLAGSPCCTTSMQRPGRACAGRPQPRDWREHPVGIAGQAVGELHPQGCLPARLPVLTGRHPSTARDGDGKGVVGIRARGCRRYLSRPETKGLHTAHDHRFGSISLESEVGQGTPDGRLRWGAPAQPHGCGCPGVRRRRTRRGFPGGHGG